MACWVGCEHAYRFCRRFAEDSPDSLTRPRKESMFPALLQFRKEEVHIVAAVMQQTVAAEHTFIADFNAVLIHHFNTHVISQGGIPQTAIKHFRLIRLCQFPCGSGNGCGFHHLIKLSQHKYLKRPHQNKNNADKHHEIQPDLHTNGKILVQKGNFTH